MKFMATCISLLILLYSRSLDAGTVSLSRAERQTPTKDDSTPQVVSNSKQVCGKQLENSSEQKLKYPWHIALYKKNKETYNPDYLYMCGGTLIDSNKVLTAAACLWNGSINKAEEAKNLMVASGKIHRSWQTHDVLEQRVGVARVILAENFTGPKTFYSQDIAVLILSDDLHLSDNTMPACLDLDLSAGGIPKGQPGHIIGWNLRGTSDNDTPLDIWLEYLELNACRTKFENKYKHFNRFLVEDKYCVLYNEGVGPEPGSSGGGMTFKHDGLHYVYGIVSVKASDQNEFAGLTNVTSHRDWLKSILH